MKKNGFTLIEVMAVISIIVLFFTSINFSISYLYKLQEPSLDEFSDTIIKCINDARFYCINNEARGQIQQIEENDVIRFRTTKEELMIINVPKSIKIYSTDTNNFKQGITIDKYGSITPVKDIVIKSENKERRIKVNFYSRGIYEK